MNLVILQRISELNKWKKNNSNVAGIHYYLPNQGENASNVFQKQMPFFQRSKRYEMIVMMDFILMFQNYPTENFHLWEGRQAQKGQSTWT